MERGAAMERRANWFFIMLLAALASGCEDQRSMQFESIPPYMGGKVRVVAVAPFNNRSSEAGVDEVIAGRLAERLKETASYNVIGPKQLVARLAEKGLNLPTDDAAAAAAMVAELGGIDAVILGTVDKVNHDMFSYNDIDNMKNYSLYPYRGLPTYSGYTYYYPAIIQYTNEVWYVAARAGMYSVPDGDLFISTESTATDQKIQSEYIRPKANDVTGSANQVVEKMVKVFTTTTVTVKTDGDTVLRTAYCKPDTKELTYAEKFNCTDKDTAIIIQLPPEAARNRFRVVIVPANSERPLVDESFVWASTDVQREIYFDADEVYKKGGTTQYRVILYRNDNVFMMEREFVIAE